MVLDPEEDAGKKARRDVAAQRRFSTSTANVPSGISANNAADNCTGSQYPGISVVRHQQEQQQVSAAGDGQRDNRGVDYRNKEKAQCSQVRKPAWRKRAGRARRSDFMRRWGKDAH